MSLTGGIDTCGLSMLYCATFVWVSKRVDSRCEAAAIHTIREQQQKAVGITLLKKTRFDILQEERCCATHVSPLNHNGEL